MAARRVKKAHPLRTGNEIFGGDVLIAVRREVLRGLIRECIRCTHDVQDAIILPMTMSPHITAVPMAIGIGYEVRNCANDTSYTLELRGETIDVTTPNATIGTMVDSTDSLLHLSGNTFAILLRDDLGLDCDAVWRLFTVGETLHEHNLSGKILMPLRCEYGIIYFVNVKMPLCIICLLDTNAPNPKIIWDLGIFLESDQYRTWPKGANLL